MPQNENLSKEWKTALGPDWARVQNTYLHTLGNLTLTGYNSEYSDRPFERKRDMKGGFKESPLRLNEALRKATSWNEEAILRRAEGLSAIAVDVWRAPSVNVDVLAAYTAKTSPTAGYGIEDHPYLLNSSNKELFEAFRREVLAIDPCVSEEFLKLYVAYKAETNFVDVVPQAKRLRLALNMAFSDLNDPKGICVDVTNRGRWGNGDVEVGLASLDELPYVMSLVRQSFEQQMGDGG
jgi:predicted transport protein